MGESKSNDRIGWAIPPHQSSLCGDFVRKSIAKMGSIWQAFGSWANTLAICIFGVIAMLSRTFEHNDVFFNENRIHSA